MGRNGFTGAMPGQRRGRPLQSCQGEDVEKIYYTLRYDIMKNHKRQVRKVINDVSGEGSVMISGGSPNRSTPFMELLGPTRRRKTRSDSSTYTGGGSRTAKRAGSSIRWN